MLTIGELGSLSVGWKLMRGSTATSCEEAGIEAVAVVVSGNGSTGAADLFVCDSARATTYDLAEGEYEVTVSLRDRATGAQVGESQSSTATVVAGMTVPAGDFTFVLE